MIVLIYILMTCQLTNGEDTTQMRKDIDLMDDFDELHVDDMTNDIVDTQGRVRIFHGVNFVGKQDPWYHRPLLEEKYAQNLGEWGLNVVRLGTMWTAVEPEEGVFDEGYIEKLKEIVKNLEKHGVWVLLDMHQDVASGLFGTYDGFPRWLVEKLREKSERRFPWPLEKVESWFCGYVTYEACDVYQRFYNNEYDAVTKFARVWKYIASHFKDHKNIIGYDLMNEPWSGNIYKDGTLLMPAESGRKNLAPMYDQVVSAIRKVDTKKLIFWESLTYSHWAPQFEVPVVNKLVTGFFGKYPALSWLNGISRACGSLNLSISEQDGDFCQGLKEKSSSGAVARDDLSTCIATDQLAEVPGNSLFGTGFSSVPGGDAEKQKSVLSWHYYFPLFLYDNDEHSYLTVQAARKVFGPMVFSGVAEEVKKLGGGSFLTEFGLCTPDSDRPESFSTQECNYVLGKADEHKLSWIYWDTSDYGVNRLAKLWDGDGNPKMSNVRGLSRPYPMVAAGKNLEYKYDVNTKEFNMKFSPHTGGVSYIYVPQTTYGKSPSVLTSADLLFDIVEDKHGRVLLKLVHSPDVPSDSPSWLVLGQENVTLRSPHHSNQSWLEYFSSFLTFRK